jgi:hypothetical protein
MCKPHTVPGWYGSARQFCAYTRVVATYYQPCRFCNMQEDQTGGDTYAHSPPCSPAAATLLQPTTATCSAVGPAHPPTATPHSSAAAPQLPAVVACMQCSAASPIAQPTATRSNWPHHRARLQHATKLAQAHPPTATAPAQPLHHCCLLLQHAACGAASTITQPTTAILSAKPPLAPTQRHPCRPQTQRAA